MRGKSTWPGFHATIGKTLGSANILETVWTRRTSVDGVTNRRKWKRVTADRGEVDRTKSDGKIRKIQPNAR